MIVYELYYWNRQQEDCGGNGHQRQFFATLREARAAVAQLEAIPESRDELYGRITRIEIARMPKPQLAIALLNREFYAKSNKIIREFDYQNGGREK